MNSYGNSFNDHCQHYTFSEHLSTSVMAYSDPQRGRDAVQAWRKANPELVKRQRRAAIVAKAVKERRFPRLSSITRHGLSDEDLERIASAVMGGRNEAEMHRVTKPAA